MNASLHQSFEFTTPLVMIVKFLMKVVSVMMLTTASTSLFGVGQDRATAAA
jgi:hypothetical protein